MNPGLKDYFYDLPVEKIAKFPLIKRDESKLLVYKDGIIIHDVFKNLNNHIDSGNLLVFNETRVIHARLIFHRQTGAKIEIFCLEPSYKQGNISEILDQKIKTRWICLVGNKDKWRKKNEILFLETEINGIKTILSATIVEVIENKSVIEFCWNNELTFYQILEHFGNTPIPPYLNREVAQSDNENYQTIYARVNGAVAAPTAGFHFTDEIFCGLENNGAEKMFITLHVSAGTFQPIRTNNIAEHLMHEEQVIFSRNNIEKLLDTNKKIISVGTTSLRALESLYWFGVKLLDGDEVFNIEKLFPYGKKTNIPDRNASLKSILCYMDKNNIENLTGTTSVFIFPGYKFKMTGGLITNYHMPGSTLLLLIAAFTGNDWKTIYHEALNKDYRFLSYGDSSLLLPREF